MEDEGCVEKDGEWDTGLLDGGVGMGSGVRGRGVGQSNSLINAWVFPSS